MNWVLVLKSLHVLSAITAVGTNLIYGVWSAIARREPAHLSFALRGIKLIDDRVANPAYGVLLLTGVIVAIRYYDFGRTWILIGLGLRRDGGARGHGDEPGTDAADHRARRRGTGIAAVEGG